MSVNKKGLAFIAAFTAFLSVTESLFYTPMPFFKLGFSNIPVCISLTFLTFPQLVYVVFIKVIFSSLFKGTLFSYPFIVSLSGNILFLFTVVPFYKFLKKHISFFSISILGAFVHNVGQIFSALLFLPKDVVTYLSSVLFIFGIISGAATGLLCNIIYNNIRSNKVLERLFNE